VSNPLGIIHRLSVWMTPLAGPDFECLLWPFSGQVTNKSEGAMPSPMLPSRVARLPALLPGARKGGAQPNGAEPRPHVERESGANTAIKPSLPPAIGVALSAALITVRVRL
jgi:hypothetical protein